MDLRRYLEVLRHRWRLIVGTLLVVVSAVAVGTFLQTPVYRAMGVMELRGQGGEGVPVEALLQAARLSTQFLESQYQVLRSPALARRVIAKVGPVTAAGERVADSSGARAPSALAGPDSAAMLQQETDAFASQLIVDPVPGSGLVRIYFESPDPSYAAGVVNEVFETFAQMRLEAGRTAVERLASEVDNTRQRLTDAERALQAYARENGLAVVGTGEGAADNLPHERLRLLQQQLTDADADRYSKESLADTRGDGLVDSEVLRTLALRLADLRAEYAKLRSTFKEDYPRTKEVKGQLDEVEAQLSRERERVRGEINSRYAAAVRRQRLLQAAIDEQRALVDQQGDKTTQYRILARDVEAQQALYAKLQEKIRAAEVSAAVAATDVNVIEPAVAPTVPVRPVPSRNIQLAIVVGLVLGLGLAFLKEYTDGTIRSVDAVESLTVPLLGTIPSLRHTTLQRNDRRARQIVEEAFGSLRTAVLFDDSFQRYPARSLLVTSAQPAEGKTTISVNLAVSLARLGKRVLLVDADTRRPSVHRALGLPAGRGLGDVLKGHASWTSMLHSNVVPGLDVLPAGAPLMAPTELLSADTVPALFQAAAEAYDFLIVDSPALHINAADTRLLAPLVDGVIMVVRSGVTPRDLVQRLLRDVPNLVGVVLNDFDFRHFPQYYQSYGTAIEPATSA